MTGRHGSKYAVAAGRRLLMGLGAGAGAFVAAAAMATGSAAPAAADFEDLLDPIVQPILASLTDSIAIFDPAAAVDFTTWTDGLLSSLGSIDFASPTADSALSAAVVGAEPAASTGVYDIPITLGGAAGQPATEPIISTTVAGVSTPLLVDTGSSGLVIPSTQLGDNFFSQLQALGELGTPTGLNVSGYSGGVEYLYLTYNDVDVTYGTGAGALVTDNTPVEVEIYSFEPGNFFSLFTNDAFQDFLGSNGVDGILGIGANTAGPAAESPLEAAGIHGVLIDLVGADKHLEIGGVNPLVNTGTLLNGAPNVDSLYETLTHGTTVTSGVVDNDLDSGGVWGTIPSSVAPNGVSAGDTVSVYTDSAHTHLLYSYVVGASTGAVNGNATIVAPTVISGTSIDSGFVPFLTHEAYIDYGTDKMYWGPLTS